MTHRDPIDVARQAKRQIGQIQRAVLNAAGCLQSGQTLIAENAAYEIDGD